MKKKFYDRTEALSAMYDLKEQGYKSIILQFVGTGKQERVLYLGCNPSAKTKKMLPAEPFINVDDVESYLSHVNDRFYKGRPRRKYWWIFGLHIT